MKKKFQFWRPHLRKYAVLASAIILSSCTETQYVEFDSANATNHYPYRTVAYQIEREFYNHFPNCVLILPASPADISQGLSNIIETALARHLERKFNRVIDGMEREVVAAAINFDLGIDQPKGLLAKKLGCDAYLETEILKPHINYLLVWSQIGLGLNIQLSSTSTGNVIWQARHEARRSEGGLSLSPLGALLDSAFSTRFAADREAAEGIVDDAIRRMIVPLPNLRTF